MRADSMVAYTQIEDVLKNRLAKKESVGILQPIDDDTRATFIVRAENDELRAWKVDAKTIGACDVNERLVKTLGSRKHISGYAVYLVSSR